MLTMKISFTKKPMNPMIENPITVCKQIFLYSARERRSVVSREIPASHGARRGREGEGGVGEGGVRPRARLLTLLRPPLVVEDVEDGHGEQAHRHHRHQPEDRALDPPVAEDGALPAAALAAAASVPARRGGRAAGGLDGASVGEAGQATVWSVQVNTVQYSTV